MNSALVFRIDIVVPLIGICILIPLAAASFFEAKKDYSRRIYCAMLYMCAALVILETLEMILSDRSGVFVLFYRMVYMLFYIVLICLCCSWTFYAYYWFRGYPAMKKTAVFFAAGPIIEILALGVNAFAGSIYYIDDRGIYYRGSAFSVFIMFCYFYMIFSIIITSALAFRKGGKQKKHDVALFLLFFIFPVMGPVMQYFVPDLSVMGVSEAIALLTVFVAVQQRMNAAYAVEKALYQDENRRYEKTIEEMLSAGPEAISIFRLNLTRNIRIYEHVTSMYLKDAIKDGNVDEILARISGLIEDPSEAKQFSRTINRKNLIHEYDLKKPRLSMHYHRRIDNGESHCIRVTVSMLQNPATHDIEAILFSEDADRQEKEEKVIFAITNREYEYIALIDTETEKIHYQYTSASASVSAILKMGNYDEVIRGVLSSALSPGQTEEYFEKICYSSVDSALKAGDEYSVVIPYGTHEGDTRQKRITFLYLDARKKEILFSWTDITEGLRQEREHAERLAAALKEARYANVKMTEFLSNVSHDMRTPLNAVLGYTNLARQSDHPEMMRDYLEKIDRSGRILLSLINDTLELSKIESGEVMLKKAPVTCSEVISKVMSSVQPAMDEKHIRFILDNSRAVMATIYVDALRLQDIFINLLSNAVKFTPEYGQITLMIECVRMEKDYVHDRIAVRDNGCGMSPEFLPKVFEPFSQERLASTADVGGSGLGLSIVKKLVDLMGGTITVKSELGRGTEFTVLLDLERADKQIPEKTESGLEWQKLKGRRVLLVEDNAMNTEIAKAVLEMKGISVVCSENGEAGCLTFAESENGAFDAILMDIRMPVMNGLSAAKKIRGMNRPDAKSIPIIAMSADAFAEDIAMSLSAGMNAHIAKPVDPANLYDTLLKCIDESRRGKVESGSIQR